MSLALLSGAYAQSPDSIGTRPHVPAEGSSWKDTLRISKTHGQVEVGGIAGAIPYTTSGPGSWNAFGKGMVGFELAGIPLQVLWDVGTDVPVRGQRNSIRLVFDRKQIDQRSRWADAGGLMRQQAIVDSLKAIRGAAYRQWRGTLARLEGMRGKAAIPDHVPHDTLTIPELPRMVEMPEGLSLTQVQASMPALPTVDGQAYRDSLTRLASEQSERLQSLDDRIAKAEREQQRQAALVRGAKGGVVRKFLLGIDHLDIGSCSPSSSEFLINGITFQGISFAYAQHDIYVSFDHGRSFDDAWRNADGMAWHLQALQQSLFLADTRDLNPRALTAVRVGLGAPDRSHFHVGYLHGEREALPGGYFMPPVPGGRQRNDVLEVDAGVAVTQQHLVRFIMARSVSSGLGEGQGGTGTVGDLLRRGEGKDLATKVTWSSRFGRSGTAVDLEGRSIAPYFQSFGMGFVRSGSRALEAKVTQSMGKRLRLRGRYTLERREQPGGTATPLHLQRIQAQVMYRATSGITLRGSYLPVVTRSATEAGELVTHTGSTGIGMDVRKRWHGTTLLLNVDVSAYDLNAPGTGLQRTMNYAGSTTLLLSGHWRFRASWNALVNAVDTVGALISNTSLNASYENERLISMDGSLLMSSAYSAGWQLNVRRIINKQFIFCMKIQNYSKYSILFQYFNGTEENNIYTWSASLTYKW
ncbi:MAG: hypothetical protein QM724_04575 [Flavobacteriales bacterium]